MRTASSISAVILAALLLLASPALAQGVEVFSGQKITGAFDEPNDTRIFRIQAVEGDLLTLKLSVSKKSDLLPVMDLIGPGGRIALPAAVKGKVSLKKAPLGTTGTYYLFLAAAGTTGEYKLALKIKGAKLPKTEVGVPSEVPFSAPRGAVVTATVKAVKGSDLEPGIDSLLDSLGADHLDPLLRTEKGKSAKLKKHPVAVFGEQRLALAARAGSGNATVSLKIKPAKPAEKKLTEGTLVDSVLLKTRSPEDGGGFEYALLVEVEGGDVTAAKLVDPNGTETSLEKDNPGEFELEIESDDEADMPDGLYRLVVTRAGGISQEIPVVIGGPWPTAVEVTSVGSGSTPTITWTGGAGAQAVFLSIEDLIEDDDAYEILLPGGTASHTVPGGPLTAGTPYEIEVFAVSAGNKVVGAGEVSGSTELEVTDSRGNLVSLTTNHWAPTEYHALEASLGGTGIRDLTLEFPSGHRESMSNEDGTWRYRAVSGRLADFEEGTYVFEIEPIEGATDRSHTFTVGGGMPDWSQGGMFGDPGLIPSHMSGAGSATPLIEWPDLMWAGGYDLVIRDRDDEVVHAQAIANPATTSYGVPGGVLDADTWYTASVAAVSSQGKSSVLYSTFYTGAGVGQLSFELDKIRGRIGGGSTLYVAETYVWVEGSTLKITGARAIHEDGTTTIDMKKDGDEYGFETGLFNSESELDGVLPDGLWRFEVTFSNGSVCTGIYTWVGGEWPDWITVVSPVDGATGVSRTPGITWTYGSLDNVDSVSAEFYSDNSDEDYAFMWDREPTITTIPWAGFDEKYVTQLPANKKIDVDVSANNGHNKETITVGDFKTGD